MPTSRAALAIALTLLAGCADDSIAINLTRLRDDPDDFALLDEATALLGLTWHESDARRAVFLTLVDADPTEGVSGTTALHGKACIKVITSWRDVRSVAHELGHAFGLDHTCEGDGCNAGNENLMTGIDYGGLELTEEQQQTIDKRAQRFRRCIR